VDVGDLNEVGLLEVVVDVNLGSCKPDSVKGAAVGSGSNVTVPKMLTSVSTVPTMVSLIV
jgi:hypothetical protein